MMDELNGFEKYVEELQGTCQVFCYPYGNVTVVTAETERVLIECGYTYCFNNLQRCRCQRH